MIEIYKKIIEYVDEHINREITIAELLKKMGYSRRHLYKMFQDHNETPIMEYIRRKKMYAASGELLSGKNMYDIALDYGYETPAGFYKAFKSVFGCSPSDYKNNMLRGVIMDNQTIKSIEELTKEIELDLNNAELYIQRGKGYLQSQQPEKAIEDYNKALELNLKNKAEAYRELGHAYFHSWQVDKIIENYTKAIELEPNVSADYLTRGQAYKNNNEYDKAVEDFTKGLELDPKAAWAYCHRGVCYFKLGEPDKAAADFDEAIEVSTDLTNTYFQLGTVYNYDLKQNDKAMEYYAKAIDLNPKFEWAYGNRANLYGEMKLYDKAIEDYIKAIELNPKSEWAYSNRANLYTKMKLYDKAIEDYAKAIELNPKADWIYHNRFQIYEELKQYDKAIEDLNKIIELNPKAEWVYVQRGVLYEKLGQHDKAAKDFDKAAALNPNHVHTYSDLGFRLYKAEQNEKAIEYFTKTMELDPGENHETRMAYLRAYLNRGCLYEDLGQDDEALADFTKAIDLRNEWNSFGDAWSYWRRALHYSKRGMYAKAVEDCCTVLGFGIHECWGGTAFDVYITRAFSFGEAGEYGWGIDDCNKALDLENSQIIPPLSKGLHYKRKDAYKIRGTIYKYMKQYDKAKEDYTKALELDPEYEEVRELLDSIEGL